MAEQEHHGAAHRRLVMTTQGWTPVSCLVADLLRMNEEVVPASSKTDLSGQYGEPEVFTEWTTRDGEHSVLREHRWPSPHSGEPDPYVCEHYAPGDRRNPPAKTGGDPT